MIEPKVTAVHDPLGGIDAFRCNLCGTVYDVQYLRDAHVCSRFCQIDERLQIVEKAIAELRERMVPQYAKEPRPAPQDCDIPLEKIQKAAPGPDVITQDGKVLRW